MSKQVANAKASNRKPSPAKKLEVEIGTTKITQEHIHLALKAIIELAEGKGLQKPESWLLLRMSLDVFSRKDLTEFGTIFHHLKKIVLNFKAKAESNIAKAGGK